MPVYVLADNHDRRDTMRDCLSGLHPYLRQDENFLHFAIDDFPVRLIGLDSVIAGDHGGEICDARETWLGARLAEGAGKPTLLFIHHPPFQTGVPAMDPMMCRTAPSFAALIHRHPEIERIAASHYHRRLSSAGPARSASSGRASPCMSSGPALA